jgi:hypothetical protein
MRRLLSFLMASAILLSGLALTDFELVRADGVRPFVLFGALVMVVISGAWLLEEFVLPLRAGRRRHPTRVAIEA